RKLIASRMFEPAPEPEPEPELSPTLAPFAPIFPPLVYYPSRRGVRPAPPAFGTLPMKNREQTFVEGRKPPEPDAILQRRINELGLKVEGSVLEVLIRELEYE